MESIINYNEIDCSNVQILNYLKNLIQIIILL